MPTTHRSPVIVVMGHIDHGKSTLLDYIRQSNIVAGEAGGITQAVGAYEVRREIEGVSQCLTFLDTPGHEAFTAIRARGAKIADIAILVISAEDGVKPQTTEALKAIQAAGIPFLVAINKVDKPNANPEKVKQELAEQNVFLEGYGGQVPAVAISAKTGAGVPELLDLLLLTAALAELEGDAAAAASGAVLETSLDKQTGVSATLIIKNGALHRGDFVVVEGQVAKVKILRDFLGRPAAVLAASAPAQIIGFATLPTVGATFQTFSDKKAAERAATAYVRPAPGTALKDQPRSLLDDDGETAEIPLVIKCDLVGSVEAVERELAKLNTARVRLKILALGVGTVSVNDIRLASGSPDSLIIGFKVPVDVSAQGLAEKLHLPIKTFNIIYQLSEWLAEELEKRTPRREVAEVIGRAKILKLFSATKDRQVVGGVVLTGLVRPGKAVKIIRRDSELGRGKIMELQEQKVATKEITADHQFGALVEAKISIAAGDCLEVFDSVTK